MDTLHTDGGCSPNPGLGGWAYVLEQGGELIEGSGGDRETTNNRMELTAVIRGLQAVNEGNAVELISDSTYVLKGLSEWMPNWKAAGGTRKVSGKRKPVLNVDLWIELAALYESRKVTCTWVKGHSGNPRNERCDAMVGAIHEAFRRGETVPG